MMKNIAWTILSLFFLVGCEQEPNIEPGKMINIFAGYDSLTHGAGTSPDGYNLDSWRNYFNSLFRGYGGGSALGWVPFEGAHANEHGLTLSKRGLTNISTQTDFTSSPITYSLDGYGQYVTEATGAEFLSLNLGDYVVTKARIYYLQQSDGGTFKYKWQNASSVEEINTNGPLSIQYFDLVKNEDSNNTIALSGIKGNIAIFGVYCFNETTNFPVATNFIAKGGRKVMEVADLNSSFQRYWYAQFRPRIFIMNGGTNDVSKTPKESFKAAMQDQIDNILAGSPDTRIIMVEPNQNSIYGKRKTTDYTDARQELATANNLDYFSIPEKLGDYSTFKSNGWMLDSTHPSNEGNKRIAEELLKFLGISLEGEKREVEVWPEIKTADNHDEEVD